MNTALLIIDVQNALVLDKPFDFEKIKNNIKLLLKASRKNGLEVIYVRHNDKEGELKLNSYGWEIYDEIKPNKGEVIIEKSYNSAFKNTNLKNYLESKNIRDLIITGMQTEYCIATTCKVAFEYGFKVIIPEKTNTTFDNGDISAEFLYEYHNYSILNNRFAKIQNIEKVLKFIENYKN
ncbi:cysteine hydrolase family protein [Clostridium thermobutyricum]|uniref:Streptothricin hydrolase n=1 Tax=Clostridium thermobutyricum DSM 4928 TaxID=1121339 RepID=A0A1V4SX92_9CLOT|nr:streptothricin hydrolase [Clostridium thermobutyricum DSM 4928]